MKTLFKTILFTFFFIQINAQIDVGPDITICQGDTVNLSATVSVASTNNYNISTINYSPESYYMGSNVTFPNGGSGGWGSWGPCGYGWSWFNGWGYDWDDCGSNALPIGFNFCFFGNTFSQFYVSSNGWISFSNPNVNQIHAFDPDPIPCGGYACPKNAIMGPWSDFFPTAAAITNVKYITLGTAPNRRLVVNFLNQPQYGCWTSYNTFQIILYEGTNVIENNIQTKSICWNNPNSVQGIQNASGNLAYAVPGRNNTNWSAYNDAKKYDPTGTAATGNITWLANNITTIGTGSNITIIPSQTTSLTAQVTACGGTFTDNINVFVNPNPTPNAGPDDSSCDLNYNLNANNSTGATGAWSNSSGAIFTNINNANTNVTVPNYGPDTFTWTESLNGCTAFDQVNINFFQQPVSDAGSDDNICGLSYTLNANPSVGIGNWSGPFGAIFSNINDPNTSVTVNNYGTHDFIWEEDNDGSTFHCVDLDTVQIIFTQSPTSNSGPDDNICGLSYTLNANPSVGIGTWTGPIGAIFNNINDPNTSVTVNNYGTHDFTWTEDNSFNCISSDDISITFYETPIPSAGVSQNICGLNVILNAQQPIGIGNWSGNNVNFSNPTSQNTNANSYVYGTNTFIWTDNNNGCIGIDSVSIIFIEIPVAQAGVNDASCGLSYTLNANPSVGTGTWTGPIGSIFDDINDPNTNITMNNYGTYNYTWTEDNGNNCIDSDIISITYVDNPIVSTGSSIEICPYEQIIINEAMSSNYTSIAWSTNGDGYFTNNISLITEYIYGNNDLQNGYVNLYLEALNPPCPTETDTLELTIYPKPVGVISGDANLCDDGSLAEININLSGNSPWNFTINNGIENINFNNVVNNNFIFETSSPGIYSLSYIDDLFCTGDYFGSANIAVFPMPISDFYTYPFSIFIDEPIVNFINNSINSSYYIWDFNDSQTSVEENAIHTYQDTGIYNVSLIAFNAIGCSDTSTINVNILPKHNFFIPSAFTPNNDNLNDCFGGKGESVKNYKMHIFSQWGELIFSSYNIDDTWCGKVKNSEQYCPHGVYKYVIEVEDLIGKIHLYSGEVHLSK